MRFTSPAAIRMALYSRWNPKVNSLNPKGVAERDHEG